MTSPLKTPPSFSKSGIKVFWQTVPQVILTSVPVGKPQKWVPPKMPFSEHLGIEYIAGYLRVGGYHVEVVDPVAELLSLDELQQLIQDYSDNLLAVGVYIRYIDYKVSQQLIQWLRMTFPDALVFTGGPILEDDQILRLLKEARAHCLVEGEGEITSAELVRAWQTGEKDIADVPGIYYLSADGQVCFTGRRALIEDLDSLPFARRDVLRRLLARGREDVWSSFSTVRGCYYPCSFCYINSDYNRQSTGKGARCRSVHNVLDELDYLHGLGIQNINFVDSTFFLPGPRGQKRAIEIAKGIIRRKLDLELKILARPGDIQDESIGWLRRAGLKRAFLGIESFVQRTLDFLKKGSTVEQNLRAVHVLRKHGMNVSYGFIVADPYTTASELRTTIEHLDQLGLMLRAISHLLLTNVALVYPNTPLERELRVAGLLEGNVDFKGGKFKFLHPEVPLFLKVAAHLERAWAYTYEIDLRWARHEASWGHVDAIRSEAERVFVPWAMHVLYCALDLLQTTPPAAAAKRVDELIRAESMVPGERWRASSLASYAKAGT